MPYTYNANPQPRAGQGVYGRVPGNINMPNPAGDLGNQLPGLPRLNSAVSNDIYAGLQGQLSPGTLNDLRDFNASWTNSMGLPYNAGIGRTRLGRNIGQSAEALKNQAIGQYNATVPTISGTQTVNPGLQTQIAEQNSLNSAAPDPAAANSHAEQLWRDYMNRMAQGGPAGGIRGGGGGGGASWAMTPNPTAGVGGPNEVVGRSTSPGTVIGGRVFYGNGGAGSDFYGVGESPGGYAGLNENDLYQNFGLTGADFNDLGLTASDLWE